MRVRFLPPEKVKLSNGGMLEKACWCKTDWSRRHRYELIVTEIYVPTDGNRNHTGGGGEHR